MGANPFRAVAEKEVDMTAEELRYGQIVIVTARWSMVFVGLSLLMWRPGGLRTFTVGILGVLALAAVNFFLHVEILRDKPTPRNMVYGMSLADLVVISLIAASRGGFSADTYVFYYPAVLVYSLVFPLQVILLLTAALTAAYGLICIGDVIDSEPSRQILVMRVLMIAAVGYLGYRYRLVERRRLEELQSSKP